MASYRHFNTAIVVLLVISGHLQTSAGEGHGKHSSEVERRHRYHGPEPIEIEVCVRQVIGVAAGALVAFAAGPPALAYWGITGGGAGLVSGLVGGFLGGYYNDCSEPKTSAAECFPRK